MGVCWRWWLVCVCVVVMVMMVTELTMASQEEIERDGYVSLLRQMRGRHSSSSDSSSISGGGRGSTHTADRLLLGPSLGASSSSSSSTPDNRRLTRTERRRLREERRLARLEIREERRRQKQDSRRSGSDMTITSDDDNDYEPTTPSLRHRQHQRHEEEEEEEIHSTTGGAAVVVTGVGVVGGEGDEDEMDDEVVDLAWLRANLSSLWHEFRAFTTSRRQQHVSSRGHHQNNGRQSSSPHMRGGGVVLVMEGADHTCPTGVEGCRGEEGQVCSGHGDCSCGHCRCQWDHYGSYCQCSDHTCQVYDGMSCGGPSRGQCRCGACMCRQGYIGEACECPTDTSTCIQPNHQQHQQHQHQQDQQGPSVCSNKGTCQCGRCRCEDGYKGMFCEDTVYAAGVCEKLRSCVLCQAWRRELISCNHCQVSLHVVESLEPSMTTCVMVNAGCIMKYSYQDHHNNSYTVKLQRNSDCPPQIE